MAQRYIKVTGLEQCLEHLMGEGRRVGWDRGSQVIGKVLCWVDLGFGAIRMRVQALNLTAI